MARRSIVFKGAWTPEKVRARIRVGVLLQRLRDHMLGRIELSATQIMAAKILLGKCLPDLRAIDISGTVDVSDAANLTTDQIRARIAALNGAASASGSSNEPSEVH